jgi:hypothetical protein
MVMISLGFQVPSPLALACSGGKANLIPSRGEGLPKVVDMAKQFQ